MTNNLQTLGCIFWGVPPFGLKVKPLQPLKSIRQKPSGFWRLTECRALVDEAALGGGQLEGPQEVRHLRIGMAFETPSLPEGVFFAAHGKEGV